MPFFCSCRSVFYLSFGPRLVSVVNSSESLWRCFTRTLAHLTADVGEERRPRKSRSVLYSGLACRHLLASTRTTLGHDASLTTLGHGSRLVTSPPLVRPPILVRCQGEEPSQPYGVSGLLLALGTGGTNWILYGVSLGVSSPKETRKRHHAPHVAQYRVA